MDYDNLRNAFRQHYHAFETAVGDAITTLADSNVLGRLIDDLSEYLALANEVRGDT